MDPRALTAADREIFDRDPSRGHLIKHRDLQISIHNDRKSSGDGRCAHDKNRNRISFSGQALSLPDAEAMLLVCNNKAKVVIHDAFLDQGMRADNNIRFTGRDLFISRFSGLSFDRSCQKDRIDRQIILLLEL